MQPGADRQPATDAALQIITWLGARPLGAGTFHTLNGVQASSAVHLLRTLRIMRVSRHGRRRQRLVLTPRPPEQWKWGARILLDGERKPLTLAQFLDHVRTENALRLLGRGAC